VTEPTKRPGLIKPEVAEMKARAVDLRIDGLTYAAIGAELGVSGSRIHALLRGTVAEGLAGKKIKAREEARKVAAAEASAAAERLTERAAAICRTCSGPLHVRKRASHDGECKTCAMYRRNRGRSRPEHLWATKPDAPD